MPSVGIFRTVFQLPSETFIRDQMNALTSYKPEIICRTYHGKEAPPRLTLGTQTTHRARQLAWTYTRWPYFFSGRELRDLDLIHAHFGPDGVMALPLAERLGIPLVTTFHGGDITKSINEHARSKKPTERWYAAREPTLIARGAMVIAVSEFVRQRLLERGYPSDRIFLHYIGVDTERFRKPPEPAESRYVLCVGRHARKKGVATLLKAWALIERHHPDVRLVQVGAGDTTESLTQLVAELQIAHRVVFMGAQPHASVLELMQKAEVFALTSETAGDGDSEALGIVFNEASACGVPIISTRHGGIPEAVLHGESGLLSPEGDFKSISEQLHAVLSDRSLGARLGARGRELVCDRFDIRKQTLLLEQAYSRVCEYSRRKHAA